MGDGPHPHLDPGPTPGTTPGTTVVRFVRARPDAVAPCRMTDGAAGYDVAACLGDDTLELAPRDRIRVPTGLRLAIPRGFEAQVRPRSGWAARDGVTVLNAPGTIDADYRGELLVLLVNLGAEPVTIRHGDRIAQLVIAPVVVAHFEAVVDLEDPTAPGTAGRGDGGFGSTGR